MGHSQVAPSLGESALPPAPLSFCPGHPPPQPPWGAVLFLAAFAVATVVQSFLLSAFLLRKLGSRPRGSRLLALYLPYVLCRGLEGLSCFQGAAAGRGESEPCGCRGASPSAALVC